MWACWKTVCKTIVCTLCGQQRVSFLKRSIGLKGMGEGKEAGGEEEGKSRGKGKME